MYPQDNPIIRQLGLAMQPISLLLLRLYVASVFLPYGIQKLTNWDKTLNLFREQYSVPFIPGDLAAIIATSAEIILPTLLILGIFSRWSALSLFTFNIVAVTSNTALSKGLWGISTVLDVIPTGIIYPSDGFKDHVTWGIMIFVIFACGAGKISIGGLFSLRNPHVHNGYY